MASAAAARPGLQEALAPASHEVRTARELGRPAFSAARRPPTSRPLAASLACPGPAPGPLTFCKVCGGSPLHCPKTGPWSLVVSRSSWARSCCSSSGTSRKVPSCAERRRGKAVTGPHQPEHGTRAWESGPSAEEPPLGPPGVQRQGGAGRGEGGWGSPRAQRYSPPLTCCLWEPESWASVLASTAASPLGEGFGGSSGGRNGRSGLRTADLKLSHAPQSPGALVVPPKCII